MEQDVKQETNKQTKYLHQSSVVANLKEKIFSKNMYNKDKYCLHSHLKTVPSLTEKNNIKI